MIQAHPTHPSSSSRATAHFLLQPGWQNSGPHHWQTLWQERLGPSASRVEQQDWMVPERTAWVSTLVRCIQDSSSPCVVLAHSVGCLAAVFAAQQVRPAALVLVAPADAERASAPEALRSFAPIPMEPLPGPALLIASDNDPYCSLERARAFAQGWRADLEVIAGAGHVNSDAGFGPWPEGWQMVGRWLEHHGLNWPADHEDQLEKAHE